ncbi:hypothetical protein NL676_035742 [Syzygium grande]|nr:hypothetical protein NL676_035742 [Syzygium grande]
MRSLQRSRGRQRRRPRPRRRLSNGLRLRMLRQRHALPLPLPLPPPPAPPPAVKSSCLATAAPTELPPASDCCLFGDGSLASPSPIQSPAQKKNSKAPKNPVPPTPRPEGTRIRLDDPLESARIGTQSRSFQLRARRTHRNAPDNSNSPNPRARDSPTTASSDARGGEVGGAARGDAAEHSAIERGGANCSFPSRSRDQIAETTKQLQNLSFFSSPSFQIAKRQKRGKKI